MSLPFPDGSAWSPCGSGLALVSSNPDNAGVFVVWFSGDSGDTSIMQVEGSLGLVRQLDWSPCSSYLITHWPESTKGLENLHIWRVGKDRVQEQVAAFHYPKQFVVWPVIKWAHDEAVCARFDADGA